MIPQPDSFQDLQLEIIRRTSFNELDGEKIHAELLAHRDLWKSALIDRLNSLTKLRDLHLDIWNADTLFILPAEGKRMNCLNSRRNGTPMKSIGLEEKKPATFYSIGMMTLRRTAKLFCGSGGIE